MNALERAHAHVSLADGQLGSDMGISTAFLSLDSVEGFLTCRWPTVKFVFLGSDKPISAVVLILASVKGRKGCKVIDVNPSF